MKILRLLLSTLVPVLVVGAIASAAPHLTGHRLLTTSESPDPSDSESPDPTDTPEPTDTTEPTDAPEPTETPEPPGGGTGGTAPDFSACVGLRGLENAICRHEALLAVQPNNQGLQNALARLQANLLKQQSAAHGQSGVSHGQSGLPHGQSGEPHGNSGQHGPGGS